MGNMIFVSRAHSVLTLPNARTYCQISSCYVLWGTGRAVLLRTSDSLSAGRHPEPQPERPVITWHQMLLKRASLATEGR